MKNLLLFVSMFGCLCGFAGSDKPASAHDTLRPAGRDLKNTISLEVLGNPLSMYYERQLYSRGSYSFSALAGLNLPMILFTGSFPGFSAGVNNRFAIGRKTVLFASPKFDLLSITLPNYSLSPEKTGHFAALHVLSANLGVGVSFRTKRWEFSPLYPCLMYSFTLYHDGEDEASALYPSVSLCTRVSYRF